jgi:hypothetical protein
MRKNIMTSVLLISAIALLLMLAANSFGQDTAANNYREGYGSYETMGQDPDAIMKYGQYMMRYGFHEMGMAGGYNKYPGYNRYLDNETIKKLNDEQEAFIKATEEVRQTIYEKELYLKAELVKKEPDAAKALSFQKTISEAKGEYEQKMIIHLIQMKKIDLEAEMK